MESPGILINRGNATHWHLASQLVEHRIGPRGIQCWLCPQFALETERQFHLQRNISPIKRLCQHY